MQKLMALVLSTLLFFSISPANAFDSTPPSLESCTISPRVVSDVTGGNVRVTIKIKSSNGLSSSVLSVLNMKNNTSSTLRQLGGFIMNRETGDDFSGTWIQDIAIKAGLMPGVYELSIFPLEDKVQNRTSFLSCPGQDVSYGVVESTQNSTPKASQTPATSPKPTAAAKTPTSSESGIETSESAKGSKLQLALLRTQLAALQAKMKKICSSKPRPKGC